MKMQIDKKYIQIGFMIFFTCLALMAVYFLFFQIDKINSFIGNLNSILSPVWWGLVLAYIMTPLLNQIENKALYPLFNKKGWLQNSDKKARKIRNISVAATALIVIALLYGFFALVIPQLYSSIANIISNYSKYTDNLVNWLNKFSKRNPEFSKMLSQLVVNYSSETDDLLNDTILPLVQNLLQPNIGDFLTNFSNSIFKVFKFIYSIVVGLIISIYVLSGKEKFSQNATKLCYAYLPRKTANSFLEAVRYIHHTFIGFLSGKVVDSLIIGIICYICCLIMRMPYPALVGVVVGVTNIIPYFGPVFGAVPSAIIILMVDPQKALAFIIMVIILQQFDGNILGPAILSESTGLSAFWIIFSITLFGGWMGVLGMIIGVPVTAVILTGINKLTNGKLMKKNLPVETSRYYKVGNINEEGEFTEYVYVKNNKDKNSDNFWVKLFNKLGIQIQKFAKWLWKKIVWLFNKIKDYIKSKKKK